MFRRLMCRLRLHRMEWDAHAYPGDYYMEPDEPGYICKDCELTYPDADPVLWAVADWFYGETRLGRWLVEREMGEDA